jgi:hypothetical protein
MFRSVRRFPFGGLALVALGFFLASLLGGGAAAGGLGIGLLFLPFLLLKMFFIFLLFGAFFRFVGMGSHWRGGSGWRPGPWHERGHGVHRSEEFYPWERTQQDREADADRRQWEQSLREARAEVDDLDAPTPRPEGGFEPPKPSSPSD